ncbi:MAG: hypothetical protein KF765_12295 [Parvibaculaceae bacterium]|nr:hypothetical protein [Parvibaculaceae bacterium]
MSFSKYLEEDRRLVILRSLKEQLDATLNEVMLQKALETFGHRVSRDVVKAQLRWLDEVGAVSLTEVGGYLIATLKARGEEHVERRGFIDGIAKPSLGK